MTRKIELALIDALSLGDRVRLLASYTVTNNDDEEVTTEPGDLAEVFAIDQNPEPQGRTVSLVVQGGLADGGVLVFDEADLFDCLGAAPFAPDGLNAAEVRIVAEDAEENEVPDFNAAAFVVFADADNWSPVAKFTTRGQATRFRDLIAAFVPPSPPP
jgi:hypothetical protein